MDFRNQILGNWPEKENYNRIVSLVPSITECIVDLGLENELVGITKFCVHPNYLIKNKVKVGGTKKLNINKIKSLNPDLIIANKEENVQDQIEVLSSFFPVYLTDVNSFEQGLEMIKMLGNFTNKSVAANTMAEEIACKFKPLMIGNNRRFLYFIWNEPKYLAGQNTFISSLLEKIGFVNACKTSRYPEWKGEEPEIVFLSTEPFPFKEQHIAEFTSYFPNAEIRLIDGEMCSWYGSRMLLAADYFRNLV